MAGQAECFLLEAWLVLDPLPYAIPLTDASYSQPLIHSCNQTVKKKQACLSIHQALVMVPATKTHT